MSGNTNGQLRGLGSLRSRMRRNRLNARQRRSRRRPASYSRLRVQPTQGVTRMGKLSECMGSLQSREKSLRR
jgi:hypothetical protein